MYVCTFLGLWLTCKLGGWCRPCLRWFLHALGLSLDPEATQVFTAHHGKVFSLHFASASDRIVLITNGPDGTLVR